MRNHGSPSAFYTCHLSPVLSAIFSFLSRRLGGVGWRGYAGSSLTQWALRRLERPRGSERDCPRPLFLSPAALLPLRRL